MSILKKLEMQEAWEAFYEHKLLQGNISKKDAADLRSFIDRKEYLPVLQGIHAGEPFPPPRKLLISKASTGKKRTVYTFDREENYVLKLLSYLLRDYDHLFAPNLYSFRKNTGVKKATSDILKLKDLRQYYVYKVDISNYFNSVDIELLLPELEDTLAEDPELFRFLKALLENPYVEYNGEVIREAQKGIMAGTPISAFLANFYLRELDAYFYERHIPYMRYSDDILVFGKDESTLRNSIRIIQEMLLSRKLTVNPSKETLSAPGEAWVFLGFSYEKGIIDVSNVSFEKLKGKMRRKVRRLHQWAEKKHLPGEYAARAFVKRFNAKLYDNPTYNELTWTRWYFPVINTDRTLKQIDEYMQDCIRYLATGKRTKGRFDFRYEDIKKLGYRSLVNEYYKCKSEASESQAEGGL
ncbi:MAG: hypothetical protein IKM59_01645 [Oscillospiraceae bacterium]|nr:hypothetical protein [Oscillospiraceae bacterium]